MKINLNIMDVALILAFRNNEFLILDENTLKARMHQYVATTDDEIAHYLAAIKAQTNYIFVVPTDDINNTVIYSLSLIGENILSQLGNTQVFDLVPQNYEFEIPDNLCLSVLPSSQNENAAANISSSGVGADPTATDVSRTAPVNDVEYQHDEHSDTNDSNNQRTKRKKTKRKKSNDNNLSESNLPKNNPAKATTTRPQLKKSNTDNIALPKNRILSHKLVAVLYVLNEHSSLTIEEIVDNVHEQCGIIISAHELKQMLPLRMRLTAHERKVSDDHAIGLVECDEHVHASSKTRYILTAEGITARKKLIADFPDIDNMLRTKKWPSSLKLCFFLLALENGKELNSQQIAQEMTDLGYDIELSTVAEFLGGNGNAMFDDAESYIYRDGPLTSDKTHFKLNPKGLRVKNYLSTITENASANNNNNASNNTHANASNSVFFNSSNYHLQYVRNNIDTTTNVTGNPPSKRPKSN